MAYRCVAVHAANRILVRRASGNDVVNETAVAVKARFLQNASVVRLDDDGLVEVLKCEAFRMVVTINGFGHELLDERVW